MAMPLTLAPLCWLGAGFLSSLIKQRSASMIPVTCQLIIEIGFVPHGGSSFYLSRMPGEIGTFLALTGLPLDSFDTM